MKGLVRKVRGIERSAYPAQFRMLQEARRFSDIAAYADADDVVVLQKDNWYAIIGISGSSAELVDLASDGGVRDIFAIVREILSAVPGTVQTLYGDFREKTSYRLVRLAERYGWAVTDDSPYSWGGETFHEVAFRRASKF